MEITALEEAAVVAVSSPIRAPLERTPSCPAGRAAVTASAPSAGGRRHVVLGATSAAALAGGLRRIRDDATKGVAPVTTGTTPAAAERLGIEFGGLAELSARANRALEALAGDEPAAWKPLQRGGIFRARGPEGRLAFLFTGQGSQYPNMLRGLREAEPVVRETLAEADAVMASLRSRPLSECVFADPADAAAVARAALCLRDAAVLQPAVLAVDVALSRVLAERGFRPDLVMGHSLGEYAALVAAGVLPFAQALEATSARAREMEHVRVEDAGRMAAVFAPLEEIEQILSTIDGYVVVANHNSGSQSVIGGETAAVERAAAVFAALGRKVLPLPVSHAFHTAIVSPASGPLRALLERLDVRPPTIPVVSNVTGESYPNGANARPAVIDLLARQMSAPVRFAEGLRTLYAEGARVFVEVGPKRALQRLADEAFERDASVVTLFTNHPTVPDVAAVSQAVCGLRTATAARSDVAAWSPAAPLEVELRSRPRRAELRRLEPVVRPPLALCRPTGITLERGRRVVVVADEGGTGLALARQLEARAVKVLLVERRPSEAELTAWVCAWLDEGPIHGVYWLPALDPEGDGADTASFREARRTRVDLLLATMRALLGRGEGRDAFLVAATRGGGIGRGAASPFGAAVCEFTKALRRERPDVLAKSVDLPAMRPADAALLLVQETLTDPGAVDVARSAGLRFSLAPSEPVQQEPVAVAAKGIACVVSGATSPGVPALVRALCAAAPGATFHLVDASDAPGVEPREDLGPAILAIEQSGGRAFRYAADLRETAAADAVGHAIAGRSRTVDLLVQADTPRIDAGIAVKPPAAFAFVFDSRVEGWRNLNRALGPAPVRTAALLQSTSGTFGAHGAADASAAEGLLAALASSAGERAPGTRATSVAWDRSPEAAARVAEVLLGTTGGDEVIVTAPGFPFPGEWDELGGVEHGMAAGDGAHVRALTGFSLTDGLRVEATTGDLLREGGRVGGGAVLPEGIALEMLAEAAVLLAPGWHVGTFERAEVLGPLRLLDGSTPPLEVRARVRPDGRDLVADCRLTGGAGGAGAKEPPTLVRARVRLTATAPRPAVEHPAPHPCVGGLTRAEIYGVCPHPPPLRVLDGAWRTNAGVVGVMSVGLPAADGPLGAISRLFELCLQTAEVLDTGRRGRPVAPASVDWARVALPWPSAGGSPFYAVVRPASSGGTVGRDEDAASHNYDARVVDAAGNVYLDIRGCRTAESPLRSQADPAALAALRAGIA